MKEDILCKWLPKEENKHGNMGKKKISSETEKKKIDTLCKWKSTSQMCATFINTLGSQIIQGKTHWWGKDGYAVKVGNLNMSLPIIDKTTC